MFDIERLEVIFMVDMVLFQGFCLLKIDFRILVKSNQLQGLCGPSETIV